MSAAPVNKTMFWIFSGIILFAALLLAGSYELNRRYYTSSALTLELDLQKKTDQQADLINREIQQQEATLFNLHQSMQELDAGLFRISETRVQPAFLDALSESVSPEEAEASFRQGLSLMPSEQALPHFQRASLREIRTADDLYLKIGTLFNILELDYTPQTACCLLYLLDLEQPSLTASQKTFFERMLSDQVPGIEPLRTQFVKRMEQARLIDQKLNRQKGNYRASISDQMLVVQDTGLALLYSPEIKAGEFYTMVPQPTASVHAPLISGLFLELPDSMLRQERQRLQKQYNLNNAAIGLMSLLGVILLISLFLSFRRQQKLNAMRTRFIATVSHELRTPLSLIRLHAETLHHGRISDNKVSDYHQTILTESERLTGIVNNVLDFSRMERGKLEVNLEPINLSNITHRITDSFEFRFNEEGFKLEKAIKPDITALADELAFSQILFNLLDNAVKYSDDVKEIKICLTQNNQEAILKVIDRGIGIPDKLKNTIFNDFVRSSESSVTARRGSGIGLSVAKKLTNMMNGTIDVADNQPTGTAFTVKLGRRDQTLQTE